MLRQWTLAFQECDSQAVNGVELSIDMCGGFLASILTTAKRQTHHAEGRVDPKDLAL
jgi:hypothetical protein